MALVVEDGTGLTNSESYCSVAFADQYHSDRGNFDWSGTDDASVAAKEQALRRSTDYMMQAYRTRWIGARVGINQALDWPRFGVMLQDYVSAGYYVGLAGNVLSTIVPVQVQQACALLALKTIAVDANGSPFDLSPDIGRVTHREKVGSLEVEYEPGRDPYTQFRAIDALLAIFLEGGGSSIRLIRG